jgi:NADH dehydrogenase
MPKRVVVVGMGFGGLSAARALARENVEVLLLDESNYHLFQPLLYQVATASVEQENIAYPIRAIIRKWKNVHFRLARVTGLDLAARQVLTETDRLAYDYLVLAAGSTTNFFGLDHVQRMSFSLKRLDDAVNLRSHILGCFESATITDDPAERAALLTFVVVGAGPTGVELCGALAELVRHALTKDFPELAADQVQIILVEALSSVLPSLPSALQAYAQRRLQRLGVRLWLNGSVADLETGRLLLRNGSQIESHTVVWAAGVKASPLALAVPAEKGRGGRIPVEADLSLTAHPEVFVVGDMAYVEQDGQALPMVAPVAMQEGRHAARVILEREAQRSGPPFLYRDRGTMAIIGRNAAVAQAFGVRLSGFAAWLAWLGLHLYYLVGFRNRLMALLNWAYAYVLRDPKLRLILGCDGQAKGMLAGSKGDKGE